MPTFTAPAIVQAVPTLDTLGLPVRPEVVAAVLQRLLSELVSQGYEVLAITPIAHGVLCTAVRREPDRGVRWYGCEGFTCDVGRHTLDCPNIDQER